MKSYPLTSILVWNSCELYKYVSRIRCALSQNCVKATISSVCPSARMDLVFRRTDFHEIRHLGIFLWKSVEKARILSKYYNNTGIFAGSIPDGVIGFFHWHNPSGRTMALGSTQLLTEMSARNVSWGSKGGQCVGLTTLPPSCADCLEMWEPQPPGTLRACPGL